MEDVRSIGGCVLMRTATPVSYDRGAVSVGIVHLGVGNFHRSHEAMYVDRLLRLGEARDWGISGVGVLPADANMRDALRSQDLEYTLIERMPDGESSATRIGAIVEYLFAPDEIDAVVDRLTDPATRIVSLTITEGGYPINDVTGQFDGTGPAVVADAQPGATPRTSFGIIATALRRRAAAGRGPFVVVSCDNIEGNGEVARRSLVEFAAMSDAGLSNWIAENVRFPNSMVDRITPATTSADRRWVADEFGVDDAWPVLAEPFSQWVIEDDFPTGRPPLELVGVQFVNDVRPYELMKLRLLNASHQAIAYFGILNGLTFVDEAARDPQIADLVNRYMNDEATPTLSPVPGVDLDSYKATLHERFRNRYIRDTLARVATDGSDRIAKFVVPVVRELRRQGRRAPVSAAIVAGWAWYSNLALEESGLPFSDRQRTVVAEAVVRQRADPTGFLRNSNWFGDLADDEVFSHDFGVAYSTLQERPRADAVLHALLESPAETASAT
jgi:mannitol 2-dehydrogenase